MWAVSVLPDMVIVELFSLSMPIEEIRERQRVFREWMGYDAIEERRKRDLQVDG
jgi:hypothetical protein